MNNKDADNQETSLANDDQLARQLAKLQQEITGLDDSTDSNPGSNDQVADVASACIREESQSEHPPTSDIELAAKLESAKKVMQLLAKMRPSSPISFVDTVVDQAGHSASINGFDTTDDQGLSNDVADPDIPSTIGRFEIQKMLGQGGFGLVFLARDPKLDRDVALKVPTFSALLKTDAQVRFQRESRVVATLSHPNIVPVYEVGNDGPLSFIASEYIQGTDLAKWIDEHGTLDPAQAAAVVAVIADAIQHAHGRKVVHRDLKPANILLETEGAESSFDPATIRVTDFGLAKMLADNDQELTRTGHVIGTPAFSAPEQLKSNETGVAAQYADIYSLGAILYYLLTGKAPFEGSSIAELVQNVQSKAPESPRKLDPNVPRDLAAICLKCLQKSPHDRYATAYDLREDLMRFRTGQPVQARPIAWHLQVARWAKCNPLVASLISLTLLAVSVGFISTWIQWRIAQTNLAETTRQIQRSDRLLLKTEDAIDSMLTKTAGALQDLPSMTGVRQQLLRDALEIQVSILEHERNNETVSTRTVQAYTRLAKIQIEMGLLEEAKESCQEAIQLFNQIDQPDQQTRFTVSFAFRRLGWIHLQGARLDEAEENAILSLETVKDPADQATERPEWIQLAIVESNSYRLLAQVAEKRNQLEEALNQLNLAELLLNSKTLVNAEEDIEFSSELMSVYNSLAIVEKKLGHTDSVRKNYEASLEINRQAIAQAPGRRDLREKMGITSINLGNLVFRGNEPLEADVHYRLAADLFEELVIQYPLVRSYQIYFPAALNGVSLVQKKSGDFPAARDTIERSIEKIERTIETLGENSVMLSSQAAAYKRLAAINSELNDYPATDVAFERASEIFQNLVTSYPDNVGFLHSQSLCYGNQGGSLITRKEFAAAAGMLSQAYEISLQTIALNPKYPSYFKNANWIQTKQAIALCGAGDPESAIEIMNSSKDASLSPDQLIDWADIAVQCLKLVEDVDGLDELDREQGSNQIRDFAFSRLKAALNSGNEFPELSTDERFRPLHSDPRFADLFQEN